MKTKTIVGIIFAASLTHAGMLGAQNHDYGFDPSIQQRTHDMQQQQAQMQQMERQHQERQLQEQMQMMQREQMNQRYQMNQRRPLYGIPGY